MNTTENNILIAEFMQFHLIDGKHYEIPQFGYMKTDGIWSDIFYPQTLKFHSNWNWLMEVVGKIENIRISNAQNSMRFDVKIKHHSCYITDHEIEGKHFIHCGGHHSKIEAVYSAVVFFVEWYNLQITNIQ